MPNVCETCKTIPSLSGNSFTCLTKLPEPWTQGSVNSLLRNPSIRGCRHHPEEIDIFDAGMQSFYHHLLHLNTDSLYVETPEGAKEMEVIPVTGHWCKWLQ